MKSIIKTAICGGIIAFSPHIAHALVSLKGMTLEACLATTLGFSYCCPTGEMIEATTCPKGWSIDGGICKRAATSGSDDRGDYMERYGTCNPMTTPVPAYIGSNNSETADGLLCIPIQ